MMKAAIRELIGASKRMHELYEVIEKVSQHSYPVLILGESGTGKELAARAIHSLGPRRQKPFAPVDCAALVPTLSESELFGHVRGAFTGAIQTRRGLIEAASEGTLFLDEIGDLPLDLQAKLLRVMQEREIRPVGSIERIPINVRVIAATNRDVEAEMRSGKFRQDLYFRLNVVQINLPPLRKHKTDIPLLVNYFIEKFSNQQSEIPTISKETLNRLMAYDWPGNVRELENTIERGMALGFEDILSEVDLSAVPQAESAKCVPEDENLVSLEELERRAIFKALHQTEGNKIAAAQMLGIGKTTFYRRLKQYGFDS